MPQFDGRASLGRRRTAAVGAALLACTVAGQSPAFASDAPVGLGTATAYSDLQPPGVGLNTTGQPRPRDGRVSQ